jgi:hypothetical protein
MKPSILNFCSKVDFHHRTDSTLFLVDFSKKTNKQRGVEVLDNETELKGLRIENKAKTSIAIGVFDDHCFKTDDGKKDLKHCEAVFFSDSNVSDSESWVLFVELKYTTNVKKFSRDFKDGKEQLLNTISIFRQNGIVEKSKLVHAVLSFPERRIYASYGFSAPDEIVKLRRREKIHFEKTNIVHFISDTIIRI